MTERNRIIYFPEGATFHGTISWTGIGLALLGAAFVISGTAIAFGIMMIPFGIVLFLNKKGVAIDLKNERVRPYLDLILLKVGLWIPLSHFDRVELFRYSGVMFMNSRAQNAWIRSFDTALVTKSGEIRLELGSFTDRKEAETSARDVAELTGLSFVDKLPPRPDPAKRRR